MAKLGGPQVHFSTAFDRAGLIGGIGTQVAASDRVAISAAGTKEPAQCIRLFYFGLWRGC